MGYIAYEDTVKFVRKYPNMSVEELATKLEEWMKSNWEAITGFGDEL